MRDYSKVSPAFWTSKTGKALRGDHQAQVVAMYLLTCRHATMIGVFSCPLIYIAHETGSPIEGASKALQRLIELDFCTFDEHEELIWVHEMACYQIADMLKPLDKRVKDIQKQVEALPEGKIKQGFIERYQRAFHLLSDKPLRSPLEAPPKPVAVTVAVTVAEEDQNPPASAKPPRGAPKPPDGFEAFWEIWPKRVERQRAEKAWAKLKPDVELQQRIHDAVRARLSTVEWRKDGGQFIPHAATWLNGRRWEDEIGPADLAYSTVEIEVMTAYNVALADAGWPQATATPFSPQRAQAIGDFLGFGNKPGWVEGYFGWLREHLEAREGYGFDWAVQRATFLRAKEGNFAALREGA